MQKKPLKKIVNDKNYRKFRDHFYFIGRSIGVAHSICDLKLIVPNEVPVVFHDSSDYDYHFITKQLANEFEGQCGCLGENIEKNKTFSISIEK